MLSTQADVVLVLGSKNSSNSQRLQELGREQGKQSYLIDGPQDIDPQWFTGNECVLVTAGASAPESVVNDTVEWLKSRYGAIVRQETIREEQVHFPLPKPLRHLAKAEEDGAVSR